MQKLASRDLGLSESTPEDLGSSMTKNLGIKVSFFSASPAGGVRTSTSEYAKFLQMILQSNELKTSFLGQYQVCASPKFCPEQAVDTPIDQNENWSYSLGHWVESDEQVGDGTFSSPGAFGFYPWIDASKEFYGILTPLSDGSVNANESVQCGRQLRRVFLSDRSD